MKYVITLIILTSSIIAHTQMDSNWKDMPSPINLEITKNEAFKINMYNIIFNWSDSLYSTENGIYGGILSANILKEGKSIQIIRNLKDNIGLNSINISFFDYNMDGYIDFSYPIQCGRECTNQYFLFNNDKQKFVLTKNWNHIRIKKINQTKNQISAFSLKSQETQKIFFIKKNNDLVEVVKIK